ncbi:hypothetical protein [Flindersiella endophytica]
MAEHDDAFPVDLRLGLEPVERAAEAPRPGADGTPLVVGRALLARFVEQGMDAVAEVVDVGIDVLVTHGRDAVAAFDHLLDRPPVARTVRVVRTGFGDLVAAEVEPEEHRNRRLGVREEDEQPDTYTAAERQADLVPGRLSAERAGVVR